MADIFVPIINHEERMLRKLVAPAPQEVRAPAKKRDPYIENWPDLLEPGEPTEPTPTVPPKRNPYFENWPELFELEGDTPTVELARPFDEVLRDFFTRDRPNIKDVKTWPLIPTIHDVDIETLADFMEVIRQVGEFTRQTAAELTPDFIPAGFRAIREAQQKVGIYQPPGLIEGIGEYVLGELEEPPAVPEGTGVFQRRVTEERAEPLARQIIGQMVLDPTLLAGPAKGLFGALRRGAAAIPPVAPAVEAGEKVVGEVFPRVLALMPPAPRPAPRSPTGAIIMPDLARQPAEGMTRLYRAEFIPGAPRAPGIGEAPSWVQEQLRGSAQAAAAGRWFTESLEEAKWYLKHAYPEGHIVYVDVPTAVAQASRLSNLPASHPARRFSRRPDLEMESFLPSEFAAMKQPLPIAWLKAWKDPEQEAARQYIAQTELVLAALARLSSDRAAFLNSAAGSGPLSQRVAGQSQLVSRATRLVSHGADIAPPDQLRDAHRELLLLVNAVRAWLQRELDGYTSSSNSLLNQATAMIPEINAREFIVRRQVNSFNTGGPPTHQTRLDLGDQFGVEPNAPLTKQLPEEVRMELRWRDEAARNRAAIAAEERYKRLVDLGESPELPMRARFAVPPGGGVQGELPLGQAGMSATKRPLTGAPLPIQPPPVTTPPPRNLVEVLRHPDIPFEAKTPEGAAALRNLIRNVAGRPGMAEEARQARLNTPPGQAPRVNGVSTMEFTPSEQMPDPAVAAQELADHLTPVPGVSLSHNAVNYFKTGDLDAFVAGLKPDVEEFEALKTDDIHYVGKFADAWESPVKLAGRADGGHGNGAIQRGVIRPINDGSLAAIRYGNNRTGQFARTVDETGMNRLGMKQYREKSTDVLAELSDDAARRSIAELLQEPKIAAIVHGLSPSHATNIVMFAKETRQLLTHILTDINKARAARGQELIGFQQNYVPAILQQNLWSKYGFGRSLPEEIFAKGLSPDLLKPNKAFNARAMRDLGVLRKDQQERDLLVLVRDYIVSAQKDIFFTEIIRHGRKQSEVLRARADLPLGNPHRADTRELADAIDRWISEAFAGVPSQILDKGVRESIPALPHHAIAVRRQLNRAVFPLNLRWALGVQLISGWGPVLSRAGLKNTFRGLMDYAFNLNGGRTWVHDNVYASIVKRQRGQGGSVLDAYLVNTAAVGMRLRKSPLDTYDDVINFLGNAVEDILTGSSARAGYYDALDRGLRGRPVVDWASDMAASTQSMPNKADRPGMMRSELVQALVPHQAFAFDLLNMMRETMPFVPTKYRTGAYATFAQTAKLKGIFENLRAALYLTAYIYVSNVLLDEVAGIKPWDISSGLPFFGVLVGGAMGSRTSNFAYFEYTKDFFDGMRGLIARGDPDDFIKWFARHHISGGVQIERLIRGALLSFKDGTVTNSAGRELFAIDDQDAFDKLRAMTLGPYGTKAGQQYVEQKKKEQGPFSEFLGGIPTAGIFPVNVNRELNGLQAAFGEAYFRADATPHVYKPADYATKIRELRPKYGVKRWFQKWDSVAPPLALEYGKFEEVRKVYDALPTDPATRKRYLQRNPSVDAQLFFWGDHDTVQTFKARQEVLNMMERWDVPNIALPDRRWSIP